MRMFVQAFRGILTATGCCASKSPDFAPRPIPPSDHFDGKRFFVPWKKVMPSFWNAMPDG